MNLLVNILMVIDIFLNFIFAPFQEWDFKKLTNIYENWTFILIKKKYTHPT